MKLVDTTTGREIKIGDQVKTFRGEPATVKGFRPPHKPGSSGRVIVDLGNGDRDFFPGVINARLVE
jgi:hypothetical protein